VKRPRYQFLSCTGFSLHNNAAGAFSYPRQQVKQFLHRGAFPDHVSKRVCTGKLAPELFSFRHVPHRLYNADGCSSFVVQQRCRDPDRDVATPAVSQEGSHVRNAAFCGKCMGKRARASTDPGVNNIPAFLSDRLPAIEAGQQLGGFVD
jgi:hypothetical protein